MATTIKINSSDGMNKANEYVDALKESITDSVIVQSVFEYIGNKTYAFFAKKEAPNNRIKLMELGVGELIIQGMIQHPNEIDVQQSGVFIIATLTTDNAENQKALANLGAGDVVVQAMGLHKDAVTVQTTANWAIANLLESPENIEVLKKVEGIAEAVAYAMTKNPSDKNVKECGLKIMKKLFGASDSTSTAKESSATASQATSLDASNKSVDEKEKKPLKKLNRDDPLLNKYKSMINSGLAQGAIEQSMIVVGEIDPISLFDDPINKFVDGIAIKTKATDASEKLQPKVSANKAPAKSEASSSSSTSAKPGNMFQELLLKQEQRAERIAETGPVTNVTKKPLYGKMLIPKTPNVSATPKPVSVAAPQANATANTNQNEPYTGKLYSLKELTALKAENKLEANGLESSKLEIYLEDNDFQQAFGMKRDEYQKLPAWKRETMKKKAGLW